MIDWKKAYSTWWSGAVAVIAAATATVQYVTESGEPDPDEDAALMAWIDAEFFTLEGVGNESVSEQGEGTLAQNYALSALGNESTSEQGGHNLRSESHPLCPPRVTGEAMTVIRDIFYATANQAAAALARERTLRPTAIGVHVGVGKHS